jgi:pyruvate/2-oxoglutarate dehydrogenase complex dihydrolipoamide dehydrogenase (E3) component
MAAVPRAMTISETRGFMKVLIETQSDRILGFTMFGAGAGDVMAAVQIAMLAGLPYTAVRDAVIAHPTMPEGLESLFGNVPPISANAAKRKIGRPAAAKDEMLAHAQSV